MMDFPKENEEFQRCWSMRAGECSALKGAVNLIKKRAAAAYVSRQDQIANALRDAAAEISELAKEASKGVEAYIEEDSKRRIAQRRGH